MGTKCGFVCKKYLTFGHFQYCIGTNTEDTLRTLVSQSLFSIDVLFRLFVRLHLPQSTIIDSKLHVAYLAFSRCLVV